MQYAKLLLTLTLIVRALHDPTSLALRVHELGRRHTYYHVKPEHYAQFGHALLKTLAHCGGTRWTPELETLWIQTYESIVQIMCNTLPTGESRSSLFSSVPQMLDTYIVSHHLSRAEDSHIRAILSAVRCMVVTARISL